MSSKISSCSSSNSNQGSNRSFEDGVLCKCGVVIEALKRKDCGAIAKNYGTPGSGEALLRGQVKTLLQKVEEEAEISKICVDDVKGPFYNLKNLVYSPMGLLAPTPNNTPHVSNLSSNGSVENNGLESVTSSPVQEQHLTISQIVSEIFDGQKKIEESVESEKSMITRVC